MAKPIEQLTSSERAELGSQLRVAVLPDASGDSAPLLNNLLQELSALGGGCLRLAPGLFTVNSPIVVPSKCGLVGSGLQATILRKGTGFTAGDTLVNMAGVTGDASGSGHKSGMVLADLQVHAGSPVKTGLLVDATAASVSMFRSVRFSGAPGTALLLRETWDCTFIDLQLNNCGGPLGDSDAVIQVLGSATDRSNLLRFFSLRVESFRNCAFFVSDDGFGTLYAPYLVTLYSPKFESSLLVDNATVFKSMPFSNSIRLEDVYLQFAASAARTGVRGIDLDGAQHVVGAVRANVSSSVSVTSIIRLPRQSGGLITGPVVCSGTPANLTQIIESDAVRLDGNPIAYGEKNMNIGMVSPFGTVPLIGGPGLEDSGYRFPQLYGTLGPALSGGRNLRRAELNRYTNYTAASAAADFPLRPDGSVLFGNLGDVASIYQANGGVATLTAASGATLIVPTGKSASTSGAGTVVSARKIAASTWLVL